LTQPLFIGTVEALSGKLRTANGLLKTYRDDFYGRILKDPGQRGQMIYLPAAISDEYGNEAANALRDYYRALAQSDTAGDVQFHTWCRAGSVTRRIAFFDWLAHRNFWSKADIEEAAESFLGFAFKHCYQVLTLRRRASDNQALSMVLNCAVAGFAFGHKLSDHPTGKFLFEYGVGRLPDMIGLFPGDGYGGEGSTYTSHVNTPLAYWAAEFLCQVLGNDVLETPFQPSGTTLRKMIEMELRLISPGGLLAPWDHYGWQRGINASALAYLAKATGNPRYLAIIQALGLWSDPGYLAWGQDDPMWTLLWWPDRFKDYAETDLPDELFGWFLPKTGAALDDCARRTRLMQVWDASAETLAGVGRGQVNPNHIIFEYGGEPVLQDGVPDHDAGDPWKLPPEKVLQNTTPEERERFRRYLESILGAKVVWESVIQGISGGLLGASNSIVIDDEPWYWPGGTRVGRAEFYARTGGLQAVTADSAPFYQPRYDLKRARRTCVWTDAGFGLVLDSLDADSEHDWTSQVYTRPGLTMARTSARLSLPSGKTVLFAWEKGPKASIETVNGYPGTNEKRSERLSLPLRGRSVRFSMVIAPDATSASISREGNRVRVRVNGRVHEFIVENFEREPQMIGSKAFQAMFAWKHGRNLVEVQANQMGPYQPDIRELEDIIRDYDPQRPELLGLVNWEAEPGQPGESRLSQVDACLAQLKAAKVNEAFLLEMLRSGTWPVQAAAADVLGRRGCQRAAPVIQELLEKEHSIPQAELYPFDGKGGELEAKRWRLKSALIVALGRLSALESVPLLGRINADSRDFYGVYSVAAQALGRIRGPDAKSALSPLLQEFEINTFMRTRHALKALEKP
jgi:hypothetical protein